MILGPVDEALLRHVEDDERRRHLRYATAWDFYHGDHPQTLTVRPGEANDNVTINLSRLVANASVRALYGVEPGWTTNDQALDDALEAWRRRHTFLLTLQGLALNGAVTGHAWAKWSVPDDGRPPTLKVIDPARVTAFWNPDDHEELWAFKIEWQTVNLSGRPVQRRQLIERTSLDAWTIRDEQRVGNSVLSRWQPIGPPAAWPYSWPPLMGCQNLPCPNEVYGIADLEGDAIDLNRAINASGSSMQKVVRLYAHPRDVGFGFVAKEMQMGPGQMPVIANANARVDTLPMASDLASSLSLFDRLKAAMHATTDTPEVAVGKLDTTGPLSGAAMSILWGPLTAKTEQKRLLYGPMIERAQAQLLVLLGLTDDADQVDVETTWPEIVPVDPLQERQALQIDEQLGASKATVLEKLGYDAVEELAASQEEAAADAEVQARLFSAGQTADPYSGNDAAQGA